MMTKSSKSPGASPVRHLTETQKQARKVSASTKAPAQEPARKSGPRKKSPAGPVKTANLKKTR
jgi:hypothetical protein